MPGKHNNVYRALCDHIHGKQVLMISISTLAAFVPDCRCGSLTCNMALSCLKSPYSLHKKALIAPGGLASAVPAITY
jgi:hypothetical protein